MVVDHDSKCVDLVLQHLVGLAHWVLLHGQLDLQGALLPQQVDNQHGDRLLTLDLVQCHLLLDLLLNH